MIDGADLGWAAAIPAAITAISTLIVRVGAKGEKDELKKEIKEAQDEINRARKELAELRGEFTILKTAYFKQNPVAIDHRGPTKGGM